MMTEHIKRNRKTIHNESGFTIIEVMIAVFVFAIAGLGITQMQIKSIQGNIAATNISEASIVLSSTIEDLISLEFNDADLQAVVDGPLASIGKYNRTLTVVDVLPFKQITVTTSWNEGIIQATTIKLP